MIHDDIPEAAKHKGGPTRLMTQAILHLTHTDNQGRSFYRTGWDGPWRRLRGTLAFNELNAAVDRYRDPVSPSPDFDDLLERAVQLRGTPANIEEWARQLAADVGELTD